jgi:aminomethyltransferase
MQEELKRTPLYQEHLHARAKVIPFAGYYMPVQYPTGIVAEHNAVRNDAGLFDVSHMGEFEVSGERALDFVQYVTTNDASRLQPGQAQYSVLCQEDGTAIDDCLVYRFVDRFMLVVNASNRDKDYEWIGNFADRFGIQLIDRSDETALIALQGPKAAAILARIMETDLDSIGFYRFVHTRVLDHSAIISRTGYTGEDGFEIYTPNDAAAPIWRRLLEVGAEDGLIPVGLGARDSLRLEMGYILYGNDLDINHTPLEAGLGWVVKLDKPEFIGRDALLRQKQEGIRDKLVGFTMLERGFPRHGYEVRADGEPVGTVTSGLLSPSMDQGVGMAYVAAEVSKPDTAIEVVIRDRPLAARITRPPFYKKGSIRR